MGSRLGRKGNVRSGKQLGGEEGDQSPVPEWLSGGKPLSQHAFKPACQL